MRRLLITVWLSSVPLIGFSMEPAYLVAMRIQSAPTASHFTFILDKKTTGGVKYDPNLNHLIVDLENTYKNLRIQDLKIKDANVSAINAEKTTNNHLRFIFNVVGKVEWKIHFVKTKRQAGANLQLDILSRKVATNAKLKTVKETNQPLKKIFQHEVLNAFAHMESMSKPIVKTRLFTIVIDAGHGGKDPGARGALGSLEKNVVLAIAKYLQKEMNATANMHAILTRKGDYFVPLRERLKLARKGKADLFIAIHADAFFNNTAAGASVYALSQHGATTEAARWLAMRDNYSELGEVELDALKDRSPFLRSFLLDLAQTATIEDSLQLGNKVLDALDPIAALHYQHVAQAPFVVLKSPDIPSILVETGFISNPREEKKLMLSAYQEKIAHALHQGISQYIQQYAGRE